MHDDKSFGFDAIFKRASDVERNYHEIYQRQQCKIIKTINKNKMLTIFFVKSKI